MWKTKKISFPNSLYSIGEYAFSGTHLSDVTIDYSVAFPQNAFDGCTKIYQQRYFSFLPRVTVK